jgi:hypothetical protein
MPAAALGPKSAPSATLAPGASLAEPPVMDPTIRQEHDHSELLARLYAAADSVETTRTLVAEIRQADALADARPEVRGLVELVGRASQLLQSLIAVERQP